MSRTHVETMFVLPSPDQSRYDGLNQQQAVVHTGAAPTPYLIEKINQADKRHGQLVLAADHPRRVIPRLQVDRSHTRRVRHPQS